MEADPQQQGRKHGIGSKSPTIVNKVDQGYSMKSRIKKKDRPRKQEKGSDSFPHWWNRIPFSIESDDLLKTLIIDYFLGAAGAAFNAVSTSTERISPPFAETEAARGVFD